MDHPYLPNADVPVWILGNKYNALNDRDAIASNIQSRLWFTYRKGFSPIGGPNGPTSDAGWGCMHRCGQMMLAETLVQIHLNKGWRWQANQLDPPYLKILRLFEDRVSSLYSIHSFTSMGVSEDRKVGSWLGPNTVSQVIRTVLCATWHTDRRNGLPEARKLAGFDKWTNLVVHVTNEDGVIVEEIKKLCSRNSGYLQRLQSRSESEEPRLKVSSGARVEKAGEAVFDNREKSPEIYSTPPPSPPRESSSPIPFFVMPQPSSDFGDCSLSDPEPMLLEEPVIVRMPISKEIDDDCVEIIFPPVVSSDPQGDEIDWVESEYATNLVVSESPSVNVNRPLSLFLNSSHIHGGGNASNNSSPISVSSTRVEPSHSPSFCSLTSKQASAVAPIPSVSSFSTSSWRPLLLIVPLRLGLHELNLGYVDGLKHLFRLPQCVGILGGRPNHAVWLLGYVGDDVLCLDPHITQPALRLGNPSPGSSSPASIDGSFHCDSPIRLPFARLDPSLAVGFVCRSEAEFDSLCSLIKTSQLNETTMPFTLTTAGVASISCLFEVHQQRPPNLPPPFCTQLKLSDPSWDDVTRLKREKCDDFEII